MALVVRVPLGMFGQAMFSDRFALFFFGCSSRSSGVSDLHINRFSVGHRSTRVSKARP